jgi:uncharacterized membrane protein
MMSVETTVEMIDGVTGATTDGTIDGIIGILIEIVAVAEMGTDDVPVVPATTITIGMIVRRIVGAHGGRRGGRSGGAHGGRKGRRRGGRSDGVRGGRRGEKSARMIGEEKNGGQPSLSPGPVHVRR